MKIEFDLLSKCKNINLRKKVETIDLCQLGSELYEELDKIGMIERLKQVDQLGSIKVAKKYKKSRYEYVLLQLYLHQIIKKSIQTHLKYTYNSAIKIIDYENESIKLPQGVDIIVVMQILSIVYSIGHYLNTFVASRAVTMLASKSTVFHDLIINTSQNEDYQNVANVILNDSNYQRVHLLNVLLVLDRCDQSLVSVQIAKKIICAYVNENKLVNNSKIKYAFEVFKIVRNVAFISYDLQIAPIPFSIDLSDKEAILKLLKEMLAEYNNTESTRNLTKSIAALLNASLYNEPGWVIDSTLASKRMVKRISQSELSHNLFADSFWDYGSIFNCRYLSNRDYDLNNILKLTFEETNRCIAEMLYEALDRMENVRAGFYLRHDGRMTVIVTVRRNINRKKEVAFKLLKKVISIIKSIYFCEDEHYLLTVKFFLYYVFNENTTIIKPVIHPTKCVVCTKGKNIRMKELQEIIRESDCDNPDQVHEIEAILKYLKEDILNDVTITVSGSTKIKTNNGWDIAEIDGIIIYPNRKEKQIVIVEAKNKKRLTNEGKRCIIKKFDDMKVDYDEKNFCTIGNDAYYEMSI